STTTRGLTVWQDSTPVRTCGASRSTAAVTVRSTRFRVERLATEVGLLGELPSLRLVVGPKPTTRTVDKLSCIRFGSARYSVPNRLIGTTVTVLVDERDRVLQVIDPITGEVHAEHGLVAPGET